MYTKGKLVVDGKDITTPEDSKFSLIALMNEDHLEGVMEANAKRLVKCWNAHDELIKVCSEVLVWWVEHENDVDTDGEEERNRYKDTPKMVELAKKVIKEDQEYITIDGYYIDGDKKEEGYNFSGYECVIGIWDGDENDNDIFYYFESEEDLQSMMKTENRTDTEFVVTKVERG